MLLVDPEPLFYELGRFLVSSDATPVVYVEATVFTDQYDSVVLVSTDGAETFAANSVPGRGEPLLSLDCHGRLYVLDGTTLYRSHDSGRRWERLAELAPGSSYFSALAGGRTWWTAGVNFIGGDLVVSATGPGALFVSTVGGVYYSDDDGNTWQGMPRLGEYHDGVYADPRGVNLLYSHSPFGGASLWSFVSTDRGASFRDWPVPSVAAPEMPQAIASSAAGELTVVTRHGVYRTNDGGDHFTRLLTLAKPRQVLHAAIGAGDPPAIYAHVSDDDDATTDELVASLDGGRTWAWHAAAISDDDLAIDPQRPEVVVTRPSASVDTGFARTLDAGMTWEQLAVPGDPHATLHFDPQPPHTLYAAGQKLHRSMDYGDTWETMTEIPAFASELELDPNPGGARYVLGQRGLLYKMTE